MENLGGKQLSYAFLPAFQHADETQRLDALHIGITEFFGQRLCLAPLDPLQVKDILELGCGSGAWAIQACYGFPEANVVAVDINPLPERQLPHNLVFQHADLTKTLPFEEKKFDIVHARFVIMHLPNGEQILRDVLKLVKPGGWLLIEDPDDDNMLDGGAPLGPGMSNFVGSWLKMARGRGAEPSIGRYLGQILGSSGYFDEVNVKKVVIPISGKSRDPVKDKLGRVWKTNMVQVALDLPKRFQSQGITNEVAQRHLDELNDPERSITTDMYFSWSRRRMDINDIGVPPDTKPIITAT